MHGELATYGFFGRIPEGSRLGEKRGHSAAWKSIGEELRGETLEVVTDFLEPVEVIYKQELVGLEIPD